MFTYIFTFVFKPNYMLHYSTRFCTSQILDSNALVEKFLKAKIGNITVSMRRDHEIWVKPICDENISNRVNVNGQNIEGKCDLGSICVGMVIQMNTKQIIHAYSQQIS